ncbi:helix-turn-helix domain-containing protein [Halobacillus sp. K22]|uniref:helix-turn-helix domain-containing protein n=1 Tax=Halobacillus sp. K22 TaxID=3457431 RepID=UPI003FCD79B5
MTNETFKLIRLYLGQTQREFSEEMNIAESTIAKVETGFTVLTEKNRAKVVRKFNTDDPEFIEFCKRMKQRIY